MNSLTSLTVLGIAAVLTLSGCALLPQVPDFNPAGDSSSDNGGTSSDEIEENPFLDNVVPEGFPAEVPLPDLEIYLGMTTTEDSWAVMFKAPDLESDFADVVSQFESEGWTTLMNNAAPDGSLGVFEKGPYHVQVMGVADGGTDFEGAAISYTVVRTD